MTLNKNFYYYCYYDFYYYYYYYYCMQTQDKETEVVNNDVLSNFKVC